MTDETQGRKLAKRIGTWIYMKRREMGWTRDELAKRSGVSMYTIRNVELSVGQEFGPHLEILVTILEALGIEDPIGRMLPPIIVG